MLEHALHIHVFQKQRNIKFSHVVEDHGMIRKEEHDNNVKVIDLSGTVATSASKTMLKQHQGHQNGKKTTHPWICHHCKRKGHIRPFCYKLYGYPKQSKHKSSGSEIRNDKIGWIPKSNNVGLMGHTSQKSSSHEVWYFLYNLSKKL